MSSDLTTPHHREQEGDRRQVSKWKKNLHGLRLTGSRILRAPSSDDIDGGSTRTMMSRYDGELQTLLHNYPGLATTTTTTTTMQTIELLLFNYASPQG
jgi:hypothetical protein